MPKESGSDARKKAINRTKVRTLTKEQDEKRRRKQQLRMAHQEQRLADQQERKQAKKARNPEKKSAGWDQKVKSFVASQRRKKKRKTQEEKEFQIVLGTKHKRLLWGLGIVSLLLVAVIVINTLVPISITEYMENLFAGKGTGDGFPVAISPSNTNYIVPVGSDIAFLGDSSLILYKSNGKVLFERQHGYSSPGIVSCSSRVMVFDRGGKQLRIENRAKTVITKETEGNITTAAMADNGTFAVVTRGMNYISEVTAYNAKGEQLFVWHSAGRQVWGVALSDNGRYMAVSTLTVENGQEVTGIVFFDLKKETPLWEETYQGSSFYSIDVKDDVVMALLSDRISVITVDGVRVDEVFEGGSVTCFDNRNNFGLVVVLGMYQDSNNNRLLVLTPEMTKLCQLELDQEIKGVSAKGNTLSLLASQKVLFFTTEGEKKGEGKLETDGNYLVCKGNFAVVLGSDTMQEVSY